MLHHDSSKRKTQLFYKMKGCFHVKYIPDIISTTYEIGVFRKHISQLQEIMYMLAMQKTNIFFKK